MFTKEEAASLWKLADLEVICFVVYELFFLVYMLLNLKSQHKPCT